MIRHLILLSSIFLTIHLSAQEQPIEMSKKFFPDPSFSIATPTNKKPVIEGLCTYNEMMEYLKTTCFGHEASVRLEFLGKTPKGKDIPILYFSDGNNSKKLKVWLQGGLHGNEPAGSEGLFMIIGFLLHDAKGLELLKKLDIAILPVANIDGYIANSRTSSTGLDLNRDQTKFSDPVSVIIKKAHISWNPEASFDFHEFQPIRKEYDSIAKGGAAIYYDALFLPPANLNTPYNLRKMTIDLFQTNAEKTLDQAGYSHNFYFSASKDSKGIILSKGAESTRSSSTSYALSNSISMLTEIRGIGLGRTSFARRTNTCFLIAKTFLEISAENCNAIKKCVASADKQTIKRINDVVVSTEKKLVEYPMKFIDISKNELINLNMRVNDGLLATPKIIRKRPVAYILLPHCSKEIECLRILGVEVEVTEKNITVPVISYLITDYEEDAVKWEGIYPVKVEVKLQEVMKSIPTGSYIVRLNQKNANYAVSILEPESDNGFVSYCVTKTKLGEELPVYRFEKGKISVSRFK